MKWLISLQTCWERITGKSLATSFDGQIKIWDMRRSNLPLQYISAHPTKIFTLDFSPVKENQLVSSASDNTIKMWDVSSQPTKPLQIFTVQGDSPVWKARYTPFGEGLVTLLGTTAVRREPNNLFLWSASNNRGPGEFHQLFMRLRS